MVFSLILGPANRRTSEGFYRPATAGNTGKRIRLNTKSCLSEHFQICHISPVTGRAEASG